MAKNLEDCEIVLIFAAKTELSMNNVDFWATVHTIIAEDFTFEDLLKLDSYAEQFINS